MREACRQLKEQQQQAADSHERPAVHAAATKATAAMEERQSGSDVDSDLESEKSESEHEESEGEESESEGEESVEEGWDQCLIARTNERCLLLLPFVI